jgi:hypothetical protein
MAVDVDAHIRQRAFGALSRFRFMFSGLVAVALSMTKIHQVRLQLPINREYDVSRLDIAVNDTSVMDLMKNFYKSFSQHIYLTDRKRTPTGFHIFEKVLAKTIQDDHPMVSNSVQTMKSRDTGDTFKGFVRCNLVVRAQYTALDFNYHIFLCVNLPCKNDTTKRALVAESFSPKLAVKRFCRSEEGG